MTEEAQSTLGMNLLMDGIALGELHEPTLPEAKADVKETNAQNNIGGVGTSLVTWIKHGEMTFKVFYTGSTAQETLRTEIYDREMHNWTIVMPQNDNLAGHAFTFQGQFTSSKPVLNGTDPATLEFSVTVNSKPAPVTTWAAGLTTPFFAVVDDDTPANTLTPVPAAAAAVYEYDLEAYSDNVYIIITPTATTGTIRVNDTVVATGVPSGHLTLNTGTGAITYMSITVSELNKTPKIYWIRVKLGDTAHP